MDPSEIEFLILERGAKRCAGAWIDFPGWESWWAETGCKQASDRL
jgi:hypothetical protein